MSDPDDTPLVTRDPIRAAQRERAHPTPTADPQLVADLDRLQRAEGELAAMLAAAAPDEAAGHAREAEALRGRIRALGGAPSDGGSRELPYEATDDSSQAIEANRRALDELRARSRTS
jgi:hypothetical protein